MGSYSSVSCEEVFNSYSENRASTSWNMQVKLRCAWSDKDSLVQDLLGTPRPHPANALLYAQKCSLRAEETKYTASGQEIIYEHAIVTVDYGIPGADDGKPPTPQDPVKLISESIEPYTKVITLPYEQFQWVDDTPLKEGEEPGKVVHGISLVRTWFAVTLVPTSILDLPGSVNNAAYNSAILGLTFAKGTLLFVPPVMSRTITTAGAGAWNVKLAWDYNENEWNKVWRVDTESYEGIEKKSNGAPYNSFPEKNHGDFLF